MPLLVVRAVLAGVLLLSLTGCPTVDLGEEPPPPGLCRPDVGYYQDVIWVEIINSPDTAINCVGESGCHQRANGRSALRLITGASLSQSDHTQNYEVVTRFLNCGTPGASTFLTKPISGVDPHGGGDLFGPGAMIEDLFCGWFEDGC